jgi:hypothetical protein
MEINFLPHPLANGPSMWTVATSAKEFYAIQDQQGVLYAQRDNWDAEEGEGYTHFFDDMRLIVVCLNPTADVGLIVHEAVHVFEAMMRHMGEGFPSEEFRAYSTQFIFEQILEVVANRLKKPEGIVMYDTMAQDVDTLGKIYYTEDELDAEILKSKIAKANEKVKK